MQNPIHLDRVCVRFPELKLCMIHGADPWWDVAIRLLIKYQNLRIMTSAWSPKRLPDSLLHYMRTRGQEQGDLRLGLAGAAPEPRRPRGAGPGPAGRRAGQLSLQQREDFFFGAARGALIDGPLRTAQAGLQPVRGSPTCRPPTSSSSRRTARSTPSAPPRPSGFDKSLWERLCAMGATTMALPESVGGDGATMVDLTLVAEEIGRSLAPVPWIDHVCAARLLARLGALDGDTAEVVDGEQIVGAGSAQVERRGGVG